MPDTRKIGFVFINRFADWEYGLLAASAVEWFGAEAISLSPETARALLIGFPTSEQGGQCVADIIGAGGKPSIRDMFEGLYAEMPPHLKRQRQQAGI